MKRKKKKSVLDPSRDPSPSWRIELIDSLDSRNANLFELRSLAWIESEIVVACKNVDTDSRSDNSCS